MRAYKFRAWHKIEKWMSEPFGFEDIGSDYGEGCSWVVVAQNYIDENRVKEHENCTREFNPADKNIILLQWTGLLDKNGKPIYEGDIVVPKEMHDSNIDYYTHDKDGKCIGIPRKIKWGSQGFNVPYDCENWEVIGNIYENPEMMR